MSNLITMQLTVRVTIKAKEGVDPNNVIDEMEYNMTSKTEGAEIIDTEITEQEVTS